MKKTLPFILSILAILGSAAAYYLWLFPREGAEVAFPVEPASSTVNPASAPQPGSPPLPSSVDGRSLAPAPAPAAPHSTLALTVRSAQGRLEVMRSGQRWQALPVGARLEPFDMVRTGEGGRALLAGGDYLTIALDRSSSIRLGQSPFEVYLERGAVQAELLKTLPATLGEGLKVITPATGAQALLSAPGTSRVVTDGVATTTAIAIKGSLSFFANGRSITLGEGTYSVASKGGSPTTPATVPTALLYAIRWPGAGNVNTATLPLTGEAHPGTRFFFNGKIVVVVDAQGNFTAQVPLREGENIIGVEVEGLDGRLEKSSSPRIVRDTKGPGHEVETSPTMWNKPE